MRKLNKTILSTVAGALLAGTGAAFAVDNVPQNRTIERIYTYDNYAVVKYVPVYTNNLGCASSNANGFAMIRFEGNGKFLFASALAAQATGAKIGLGIDNCSAEWGQIPVIYRMSQAQ